MGVFRTWLEDGALQPPTKPIRKIVPIIDPRTVKWGGIFPLSGDPNKYHCRNCNHIWDRPEGLGPPTTCPRCGSFNYLKTKKGDDDVNEPPTETDS